MLSRETLRRARRLRAVVNAEVDGRTRRLEREWAAAWREVRPGVESAVAEVVVETARQGEWPRPWELARVPGVATSLRAVEASLERLRLSTDAELGAGVLEVVRATREVEPTVISSQLPASERKAAEATVLAGTGAYAVNLIAGRAVARVERLVAPLGRRAAEDVRRRLIRGSPIGGRANTGTRTGARQAARAVVGDLKLGFTGGLNRARVVGRTELLDAYRDTALRVHSDNLNLVLGWTWLSARDRRTCPSCWAMDGSEFTWSTPGPWDHPQGRCQRIPIVRPWVDLGIGSLEPDDDLPSAREEFDDLTEEEQLEVMGPTRLDLLRSGRVAWSDLSTLVDSDGWRPAYAPRSVTDLRHKAEQNATTGARA